MGLSKLERGLVKALRKQLNNEKITMKNVMQWSSLKEIIEKNLRPQDGEVIIEIKEMGVWIAYQEKPQKEEHGEK